MRLGEVRVAEDKDFQDLSSLVDNQDDWRLEYCNSATRVWTKDMGNDEKMIKVTTRCPDVEAATVFDVLNDTGYRRHWDKHMIAGSSLGCLNPNNEICYYAVSCPAPLRNRDLILQRSWLDTGREFYLLTHSVSHQLYPPRKGYVRALNYLTGFVVRPVSAQGCEVHYVAHTNPGGQLPGWLTNKVTQVLAPKMVKRLRKACVAYPAWKRRHDVDFKPWIYPEQMPSERLDVAMCNRNPLDECLPPVDESEIQESDFAESNLLNAEDE